MDSDSEETNDAGHRVFTYLTKPTIQFKSEGPFTKLVMKMSTALALDPEYIEAKRAITLMHNWPCKVYKYEHRGVPDARMYQYEGYVNAGMPMRDYQNRFDTFILKHYLTEEDLPKFAEFNIKTDMLAPFIMVPVSDSQLTAVSHAKSVSITLTLNKKVFIWPFSLNQYDFDFTANIKVLK